MALFETTSMSIIVRRPFWDIGRRPSSDTGSLDAIHILLRGIVGFFFNSSVIVEREGHE